MCFKHRNTAVSEFGLLLTLPPPRLCSDFSINNNIYLIDFKSIYARGCKVKCEEIKVTTGLLSSNKSTKQNKSSGANIYIATLTRAFLYRNVVTRHKQEGCISLNRFWTVSVPMSIFSFKLCHYQTQNMPLRGSVKETK